MSFPYEEPLQPYQNTIGEVGAYLEETHPSQYLIFNLSGEQYDVTKLNGQVRDSVRVCVFLIIYIHVHIQYTET